MKCPCNTEYTFEDCCKPVIENDCAKSPEQLMRSRYSAFATDNTDYIYRTFSQQHRSPSLKAELEHPHEELWVALIIVEALNTEVEFKAYSKAPISSDIHLLHERSSFVLEQGRWRYDSGIIIKNDRVPVSKNSMCFCNSGKKAKRCCMR